MQIAKTLCACVSVCIREMGEEGGQTELMSSECVYMYKYLCCVLSSMEWLKTLCTLSVQEKHSEEKQSKKCAALCRNKIE